MLGRGIRAVLDRPEIVWTRQHALGQQKSCRELAIGAGCPHDDGERLPVEPHFQRLFHGGAVGAGVTDPVTHAGDIDGAERLCHGDHCTCRT